VVAQGLVILSQQDTDAPDLPAVCSVSKDDPGDDGGYAIAVAAAGRGRVAVDRPYFTGNPTVSWLVEKCNRVIAAGGLAQVGNEQNLALEDWQGGPDGWRAFQEQVRQATSDPTRCLAMPPSPGVAGWEAWTADAGPHAVHAYGSALQMQDIVRWYLANKTGDVYLTECNFGAGNLVDIDQWATIELAPFLDWASTQERVKVALYFSWTWDQAATLPTSTDAKGTMVADVLQNWTPPPDPAPPEAPPGVPPDPPQPVPPDPAIDAIRDQVWSLADQAERLGHPWLGQAWKAAIALSKGELAWLVAPLLLNVLPRLAGGNAIHDALRYAQS